MHFYSVTFERFGTVGGLCKEFEQKYLVQNNSSQKEMRKKFLTKFWFQTFWSKNIFVTEKFGLNNHEKKLSPNKLFVQGNFHPKKFGNK